MTSRKRPASRPLSGTSSPAQGSFAELPSVPTHPEHGAAMLHGAGQNEAEDASTPTPLPESTARMVPVTASQGNAFPASTAAGIPSNVRPFPPEHFDRGDRKRQAQGMATSPRPFVRREHQTSFDWGPNVPMGPTQYSSTTTSSGSMAANVARGSTQHGNGDEGLQSMATTARFSPQAQYSRPRPPSNHSTSEFVLPGQPQSARHAIGTTQQQMASSKQPLGTLSTQMPSPSSYAQGYSSTSAVGGYRDSDASSTFSPHGGPGSAHGSGSGSGSAHGGEGLSSPHTNRTSSGSRHYGNIRPPSRFMNYAEGPAARSAHNVNVMDLDESLRALYFAPLPLVVLDNNRCIKMLNRPAELMFGVVDSGCIGQRMDRYVTANSRTHLNMSLNEASQSTSSGVSATPYSTRLSIQPAENKLAIIADLTISAWFSTDQIYANSGGELRSTPIHLGTAPDETSLISSNSSPASPADNLRHQNSSSTLPTAAAPHEAYFTICIMPARAGQRRDSPSSSHAQILESLKVNIFEQQELALMAVNSDVSVCAQNPACRELLSFFKSGGFEPPSTEEARQKQAESDADFSWIETAIRCWDEKFEIPFPTSEWPIYRCAVLGQYAEPVIIGCEATATGERMLLEISGRPLRDNGGYGEHIGGVIVIRDVTSARKKQRAEAVEEGDVYFKQTCDAMPQLVWVTSATGYHEWYSKSWYDYTGSSHTESRGVGWQGFFHEEDLPEAGKRWSYSLRTGELYETAYRCRRFDGQWRWFLGRALPMRDAEGVITRWFGTCTDIHDQVEALSASRRAQSQLESVIYHAAMTLWAVDCEGRITVAEGPGIRNAKITTPGTPHEIAMTDLQKDGAEMSEDGQVPGSRSVTNSNVSGQRVSMIGRSIYSIWDATLVRPSIERALAGESIVEEMEIDGRWFRTSFTPMRTAVNEAGQLMGFDQEKESEGDIVGVVGTSMDITDRKRAQERIEESLLEKTRALAAEGAAREASRLKSEFLANMSHEIRTPIAGVIGLSELLLDEKGLSPQQRDYAETIQRSAEGLLTVINDVLDFSKVEIGKLDVEKAPYNLEVLIRDAKRMLGFATQKKGLEFREAVHLNYKGQVIGDVGRLRQVITNLLTNAIKFTAKGYISLEVTELQQDEKSISVKFDVRDTGCGIKKDTLSRLFQPFSQADPSTARRFGGTGLGLSISKNLVELMKGSIGLESVEGEGSHAWFVIPFDKAIATPDEKTEKEVIAKAPSMPGSLGGASETSFMGRARKDMWILIAEDNVINAQIASKNIKRMGFSCRTAENGIKALEELGRHSYDAVLMDCQMPECDGYEATRLIRSSLNPDVRMLPVIALTASAIKGDRERALEAGMVDYLAKPVKRPALEAALCKWLYDQDARQSLAKYMAPSQESEFNIGQKGEKWSAILPAMQEVKNPLYNPPAQTAALSGGGKSDVHANMSEYPFFPEGGQGLRAGSSPRDAISPATNQRFAAVRLSPPSEAVMERLKMPHGSLNRETLSHFTRGDALSAAAVLLSARRSSVDASAIQSVNFKRSAESATRSLSHGSLPREARMASTAIERLADGDKEIAEALHIPADKLANAEAILTAAANEAAAGAPAFPDVASTGVGASSVNVEALSDNDGASTAVRWASVPHRAALLRQSSREQGGVGRDLEGEVFRALAREPGLDELLDSPSDEKMRR